MAIKLSKRQVAMLELLVQGKLDKQIAHDIDKVPSTATTVTAVKLTLYRLRRKLGFTNRTQLALWYAERRRRTP